MPSICLKSGVATFTVTATISGSATGTIVNTVTATVPAGTTDPTPGNNTATDTDTVSLVADLAITKTDGSATYTPGNAITYTIVASNNGPSAVTGATVADVVPGGDRGRRLDLRRVGRQRVRRGLRQRQHQHDRRPVEWRNGDVHVDAAPSRPARRATSSTPRRSPRPPA